MAESAGTPKRSFIQKLRSHIAGKDLFYLGGPIDSRKVKNYGTDWRKHYAADIASLGEEVGFSLVAYDPSEEEPDMLGYSFEDWGNLKTALRMNNDFAKFRAMMGAVMRLDLRRVRESRVVIVRWQSEIPAFGTIHELLYARQFGIPVVLIYEGRREELNPWLDCLSVESDIEIFSSWAEFLADLHDAYHHGFWFAFAMRLRRIVKRICISWRRFFLYLAQRASPVPFSVFGGRRASNAYKNPASVPSSSNQWVISLIGPPLAGKSTQAEDLSKLLNLLHIETSKLIRDTFENLPEGEDAVVEYGGAIYSVAEEKRKYLAKELNDTGFVLGLLAGTLENANAYNGVIFSGSPRRVIEAEALIPLLRKKFPTAIFRAFEFSITDEVALERAKGRQRSDGFDTPEAIRKRMRIYEEQTRPVVDWLRHHRVRVVRIDATRSRSHVTRMILHKID